MNIIAKFKNHKLFLSALLLLLLSSIFSELLPCYIPYNYPQYIPVTRELAKQNNYDEEWYVWHEKSGQIPEDLIKRQPTKVLAESILNSPHLIYLSMYAWNFKSGYRLFKANVDGVEELENRKDVISAFMTVYEQYSIKPFHEVTHAEKDRLSYFEVILSQEEYIGRMDEEEQKQFSEIAEKKYYEKIKMGWPQPACEYFYEILERMGYADRITPPDFSGLPEE